MAAFNRGDLDALRGIFAPDSAVQGVLGWGGMDEVIPIWVELHAAFAIELTIDSIIVDGDLVAVRFTERGVFRTPFRGKEPTGKPYEPNAMEWLELRDGRIQRRWRARLRRPGAAERVVTARRLQSALPIAMNPKLFPLKVFVRAGLKRLLEARNERRAPERRGRCAG